MNKKSVAVRFFLLLVAGCVGHALYYFPRLPEQVAHHFGMSGEPDAWGSKTVFLGLYLFSVALIVATFLGLGFGMTRMPHWAINLQNKEYWLAPERKQDTLDYLSVALFWLGSATLILLLDIFHQSIRVHLGRASRLEHSWLSLGAYLVFTIAWSIVIYRRFAKFRRPQPGPER